MPMHLSFGRRYRSAIRSMRLITGNCMPYLEEQTNVKVRLMGTKNDIVWFQKILQRHPKVEVLEISELYSNKGTNKYYRAYAEVQKSNVKSSR